MKVVLLYHQRFVQRVRSGEKRHTIRAIRKGRQIKVGDELSHRNWAGKPSRNSCGSRRV